MRNTPPFPDGFESWMLEKAWHELLPEERLQFESEHIGEREYQQMREMLLQLQQFEDEPVTVSPKLRETLLEAFDAPPASAHEGRIIPLRLWIGALATAAAALVVFLWVLPSQRNTTPVAQDLYPTSQTAVQAPAGSTTSDTSVPMVQPEIASQPAPLAPITSELSALELHKDMPETEQKRTESASVENAERADDGMALKEEQLEKRASAEVTATRNANNDMITTGPVTFSNSNTNAVPASSYQWPTNLSNNQVGSVSATFEKKKAAKTKAEAVSKASRTSLAEEPSLLNMLVTVY